MAEGVRVKSIEAVKEFRVRMAKFGEAAGLALGEADADIARVLHWLEGEQQVYWQGQIRKRQEAVSKAEEAYRFKKLYKDSSGSTQSAVEELKALNQAKQRLAEGLEKLANTKNWSRKLQKEITLYRGGVARFANDVSAGVPFAIAQLGSHIENLEKYVGIGIEAPESQMAEMAAGGGLGESAAGSMARTTDVIPQAPEELDAKALRGLLPPTELLLQTGRGPIKLKELALSPEQLAALQALGQPSTPASEDRIVIAADAESAPLWIFSRITHDKGFALWYMAPVAKKASDAYAMIHASDLLEGHPGLQPLLSLPGEFLAVMNSGGILAIFDTDNRNVWTPPAPPAAGQSGAAQPQASQGPQ